MFLVRWSDVQSLPAVAAEQVALVLAVKGVPRTAELQPVIEQTIRQVIEGE